MICQVYYTPVEESVGKKGFGNKDLALFGDLIFRKNCKQIEFFLHF
jgi:hypothetical protein